MENPYEAPLKKSAWRLHRPLLDEDAFGLIAMLVVFMFVFVLTRL